MAMDPEYKFWRNVEKTNNCWIWTGYTDKDGYGRYNTRIEGKVYPWLAHRVAWYKHHGGWPVTDALDHTCNNPSCVRIDHLEDVGRRENTIRYYQRRGA